MTQVDMDTNHNPASAARIGVFFYQEKPQSEFLKHKSEAGISETSEIVKIEDLKGRNPKAERDAKGDVNPKEGQ